MATVASYNKKYLRMTPVVSQIFDDLEMYVNWCKMQYPAVRVDESDLYNARSPLWQKYLKQTNKKHHGQPSSRNK